MEEQWLSLKYASWFVAMLLLLWWEERCKGKCASFLCCAVAVVDFGCVVGVYESARRRCVGVLLGCWRTVGGEG